MRTPCRHTVADLTDAAGGKTFTVSGWTGTGSLTDRAGTTGRVIAVKAAGFVLTLMLYGAVKREAVSWAAGTAAPPRRIEFVVPSLLVWCGVVIFGRLTAFLGALPFS